MQATATAVWRPDGRRGVLLGLIVIVVIGAVLRLAGIGFGDPYVYHPDEWVVGRSAIDMVRNGDWNPHQFFYSSLLIDAEAVLVAIRHALGGPILATDQSWLYQPELIPAQFDYVLLGRALVAAMATATIVVVFETARRLAGAGAGLVAAAMLAVAPLHVVHSVSLTTDVPLALMCALALAATFKAAMARSDRWWLVAGLLAGLAGSTKWNGLAVIGVPLLAWAVSSYGPDGVRALVRARAPWLILIGGVVGMVVATPAVILDTAAVIETLRFQADIYSTGSIRDGLGSLEFNVAALLDGAGLLLLPCLAGLALMAISAIRDAARRAWIVVPVFVVVWFAIVSSASLHYERNLVPILPYLAVAGGVAIAAAARWLRERVQQRAAPTGRRIGSVVAVIVLGAILLAATAASVSAMRVIRTPDTRDVAYAWMLQNLPTRTIIAREASTPQTSLDDFKFRGSYFLWQQDLDWYRSAGVRYLVASSWMYTRFVDDASRPEQSEFYRDLFALPEVFRIDAGDERPGPTIRIFRLDPG